MRVILTDDGCIAINVLVHLMCLVTALAVVTGNLLTRES